MSRKGVNQFRWRFEAMALWVWVVVTALGGVVACGGESLENEGPSESNTNWLSACDDGNDCRGDGECLCGVCTTTCDPSDACSISGAECVAGAAVGCDLGADAICLASCESDSDCSDPELRCGDGLCVGEQDTSADADADSDDTTAPDVDAGAASVSPRDELCGRPLDWYVSTSAEQCAVMTFGCNEETEVAFSDECGCGCTDVTRPLPGCDLPNRFFVCLGQGCCAGASPVCPIEDGIGFEDRCGCGCDAPDEAANVCHQPERSYSYRARSTCFANAGSIECEAGAVLFDDDCGCGCVDEAAANEGAELPRCLPSSGFTCDADPSEFVTTDAFGCALRRCSGDEDCRGSEYCHSPRDFGECCEGAVECEEDASAPDSCRCGIDPIVRECEESAYCMPRSAYSERGDAWDCLSEGEARIAMDFESRECCPGLQPLPLDEPTVTDDGLSCAPNKGGRWTCAECGDGLCRYGENVCNCPEDCPTETTMAPLQPGSIPAPLVPHPSPTDPVGDGRLVDVGGTETPGFGYDSCGGVTSSSGPVCDAGCPGAIRGDGFVVYDPSVPQERSTDADLYFWFEQPLAVDEFVGVYFDLLLLDGSAWDSTIQFLATDAVCGAEQRLSAFHLRDFWLTAGQGQWRTGCFDLRPSQPIDSVGVRFAGFGATIGLDAVRFGSRCGGEGETEDPVPSEPLPSE